jgi:hypothetical protein
MQPGHYRAAIDLTEGELVRGAIIVGKHTLPFGPLSAGSNAEWAFDPARVDELRHVAAQSGGRELVDLRDVWQSPPLKQPTDLRRWLLPLALVLILADALITRMGWRMPKLALARPVREPRRIPSPPAIPLPAAVAVAEEPKPESEPSAPASPGEDTAAARRRQRFARAKKR